MNGRPVTVSLYLDTRRKKKSGKFPLRLRVYWEGDQKFYLTPFDLTKEEYAKAWDRDKPRGKYKELREEIEPILEQAKQITRNLSPFSFAKFEELFFETSGGEGHDIISLYQRTIDKLQKDGRFGNAWNYRDSLRSLQDFFREAKKTQADHISFESIDQDLLEEFEHYLSEERGLSLSTVGKKTRALRAIFNQAREEGLTDNYPFGKRRYAIKGGKRTKKALSMEQVQMLAQEKPETGHQEKARDFFLLSLSLQGINLADLANLKAENKEGDFIRFYRKKTERVAGEDRQEIKVTVTQRARELIDKYKRDALKAGDYLFHIIEKDDPPLTRKRKIQRFSRYINQHLKPFAKKIGLPEKVSFQWARHTFATLCLKNGASLPQIAAALGHADIKTTQAYLGSIQDENDRELMENITDF